MAIFSLNHTPVGRTTHAPGSASLYARYITRSEACNVILGERMPIDGKLNAWLDAEEKGDRKNARVIDKVIVALPLELTRDQNIELLQAFGERMTEGRASWMAAIHDGPADANNPHAHMIFRDRDIATGRRVMLTSQPGSTQRFRDAWEQETNIALERAGREERVDKRSLADQGIAREPQIHVGAGAMALAEKNHEFRSAEKEISRLIDGAPSIVTVNYPVIDEGKTRFEENEERKARNREREEEQQRGLASNGPTRPEDARHHLMHAANNAAARAEELYRRRFRQPLEALADDGDPITAIVREHLEERKAAKKPFWEIDDEGLRDRPTEYSNHPQARGFPARPPRTPPRRGPYPGGPGRITYDPVPPKIEKGEGDAPERQPRRGASNLLAGAGLALVGRIAESLEGLFGGRTGQEIERDEGIMAEERTVQQKAQQHVAEKQTREAQEAEHLRKAWLDHYLAQRDRERHHDRGR
ncbi:MAG: MobA/MobL family protein [Alphaproteobacteria bacterium]